VLKAMERVEIKSVTIHSDKTQDERNEAMNAFKSGEVKLLIATDVSARGIDIPDVDYVVNYDIPEQPENYVHRVGRTGRGKQKGYAVAFCSEEENELLAEIEKYVGQAVDVTDIDRNEYADTIDFSSEASNDWKSLMREAEQDEESYKAVKKKRKKKK